MTFRPTPAGRKSHLPAKRPKSSQASGSAAEGIFSAAEGIFSASADPSLSDRRGLQNRESADHDTPNKPPPKGDPFPTRKAQNLLTHIILPLFQMAELGSASSGGGTTIFCRVLPTHLPSVWPVAAPPPKSQDRLFRRRPRPSNLTCAIRRTYPCFFPIRNRLWQAGHSTIGSGVTASASSRSCACARASSKHPIC